MIALTAVGCSSNKAKYNTYPNPTRHELVVEYCREQYSIGNKRYFQCLIENDPSKYKSGEDKVGDYHKRKAKREDD